jgi:hypothetical protein
MRLKKESSMVSSRKQEARISKLNMIYKCTMLGCVMTKQKNHKNNPKNPINPTNHSSDNKNNPKNPINPINHSSDKNNLSSDNNKKPSPMKKHIFSSIFFLLAFTFTANYALAQTPIIWTKDFGNFRVTKHTGSAAAIDDPDNNTYDLYFNRGTEGEYTIEMINDTVTERIKQISTWDINGKLILNLKDVRIDVSNSDRFDDNDMKAAMRIERGRCGSPPYDPVEMEITIRAVGNGTTSLKGRNGIAVGDFRKTNINQIKWLRIECTDTSRLEITGTGKMNNPYAPYDNPPWDTKQVSAGIKVLDTTNSSHCLEYPYNGQCGAAHNIFPIYIRGGKIKISADDEVYIGTGGPADYAGWQASIWTYQKNPIYFESGNIELHHVCYYATENSQLNQQAHLYVRGGNVFVSNSNREFYPYTPWANTGHWVRSQTTLQLHEDEGVNMNGKRITGGKMGDTYLVDSLTTTHNMYSVRGVKIGQDDAGHNPVMFWVAKSSEDGSSQKGEQLTVYVEGKPYKGVRVVDGDLQNKNQDLYPPVLEFTGDASSWEEDGDTLVLVVKGKGTVYMRDTFKNEINNYSGRSYS